MIFIISSCIIIRKENQIPARKDLTGNRYGKLIVVEMLYGYSINNSKNKRTFCRCKCECGNDKDVIIQASSLVTGNTTSCGCINKELTSNRSMKNVVGNTYGRLTVIEILRHYKDGFTYCKCNCSCGNFNVIISLNCLTSGNTSSCGCLRKAIKQKKFKPKVKIQRRYNYNCCDLVNLKYGYLTVINKTDKRSPRGAIIWECICKCGNAHYAETGDLKGGKVQSCGCKRSSQYEDFIENILTSLNIDFEKQKRFNDCRLKYMLPFDFYIPKYNLCIEYQGKQHYVPIKYFGGEKHYKKQLERDKIKKDYCIANNINLLCIPFILTKDDIHQEIINIINPVTITA